MSVPNTKRADFNPDTVKMYELKNGSVPQKYTEIIMGGVIENSVVMRLGKYEPMEGKEKEFTFFAEGPGAYWVGEGQKIQTSTATFKTAKMVAKKLGVILPVSREYLEYTASDFFEAMKDKIAEAFYLKYDNAVILGVDNPFAQSIAKASADAGTKITGDLTYENILSLEDKITEGDNEPKAFISKPQNRTALRSMAVPTGVVSDALYDRGTNRLDGLPIVDFKSTDMKKGTIFTGDFDFLYYGIPHQMTFKISEDAQLSTLKNEDGTAVNLFEQELVALRVTMDIATMIVKDDAFAVIEPAVTKTK